MVICVTVTSRNIFVIGYRLYVRKRLGDRLLVHRAEIDFCATRINDIEPNAVIGIDKLINRFIAFSLPGGKDAVLNQSADVLIAFVISKSRELTDVADAVVANRHSTADEHIAFASTEKVLKLI